MGIGLIRTVTSIERHTHVLLYLECWEISYTLWQLSCPRVGISFILYVFGNYDIICALIDLYNALLLNLIAIGFLAINTMLVGRFITGMAGAGRTLSYTYVSSVVPQGKKK